MSTFDAVTTCSRTGWDEYGRRMWESTQKFWPDEVKIALYSEDVIPGVVTHPMPPWLYEFKERHAKDKTAHGLQRNGAYNYRFDAVRFAHKTAVVINAFETSTADFLIWVDADTVTHSPVTVEFLESLAPGPKQGISWLDRESKYPECGFYILRRDKGGERLMNMWKSLYKRDTLFHLGEWHDSFVLQEIVQITGMKAKSISGEARKFSHPFINSPLGSVMDHMKGPRKIRGRSNPRDLKYYRTEKYWNDK